MDDITFIIFGATGDLARKKLIPALHNLVRDRKIRRFAIVGISKDAGVDWTTILAESRRHVNGLDEQAWKKIQANGRYLPMDFHERGAHARLAETVKKLEARFRLPGRRLFYLATMPEHFGAIAENLHRAGLARRAQGWPRVVFEKPFGHDLKSAREIDRRIRPAFREEQVYRIDHYLGKEFVENISLIRFTNRVLEPLWNRHHVESVQIVLDESIGIDGRGAYYDRYGALRDVVQNHALQLLAMAAMEPPSTLSGGHLRREKERVLRRTRVRGTLLGQYAGYRKEPGVRQDSKTETFAALVLEVNNPRWKGVPFFIRAGKSLRRKETAVHLKFRPTDCLLAKSCPSDANYFTIHVEPRKSFAFELNSKIPGHGFAVKPVQMEFSQNVFDQPNTPNAYENLLQDVARGDHAFFVGKQEVELSWKIVERIRRRPPYGYPRGSNGPRQLKDWEARHGVTWREDL